MKGNRLPLLSLVAIALLFFCGCAAHHSVAQTDVEGFVEIDGQVLKPGKYSFLEGMTIAALVNQAGGFYDFASGIRLIRGDTNVVDHYMGLKPAPYAPEMKTKLKAGDKVWISRRVP